MNMNPDEKIRALVVDDSALMGRQIAGILEEDGGIQVIGRAMDGEEAVKMVADLKPDVVTLDVEMPRMNGISALKHIMVKTPAPVIMISALTREGARTTFEALKYGAIDVVAKPSKRQDESLQAQKSDIITKVKRAAAIRTGRSRYVRLLESEAGGRARPGEVVDSGTRIIGVGAGTGGYYPLLRIIPNLPPTFQDTLVAVILSATKYLQAFASYLSEHSAVPVTLLESETRPRKGACYIVSGTDGFVLTSNHSGNPKFVSRGPHDSEEGPIDSMLKALARTVGRRSVGVVLSGDGVDGAEGIVAIRQAGGLGIVQDLNNCMNPSMPLAVLERGTVEKMLPDYDMAGFLLNGQ